MSQTRNDDTVCRLPNSRFWILRYPPIRRNVFAESNYVSRESSRTQRTGKGVQHHVFRSTCVARRRIKERQEILFSKMYLLKNTMKVSVLMEWAEIYSLWCVGYCYVERDDAMVVSCTKVARTRLMNTQTNKLLA